MLDEVYHIRSDAPSPISENLMDYITKKRKCLQAFDTAYKRNKVAINQVAMVLPKFVAVRVRNDQVYDKKSSTYKSGPVTCKIAYIPILDTVDFVSANKSVGQEIFDNTVSENGLMKNFEDGRYYQQHILFKGNNCIVALILYFDDCETVNPLGSKTGGH